MTRQAAPCGPTSYEVNDMNEIQNTPNLRFEGFTEPWRQRKLMEEVTSIDTGKSKFLIHGTGKYEVLGSTSVIGFDDSYDYEGDFLLTARVGANAGELYRHSGKVKISDNTVFIQGEQLDFIYYSLLNFDIKKLSFGTGQPLIKASELKTLDIKVPEDTSEQKKIGELFSNLDSLIALQQRKYERLQHLKQALLRKMFPKPGEQVPELRFEGFSEPWEQRKVSDIATLRRGLTYSPSDVVPPGQGVRVLRSSNVDEDRFVLRNDDVFVKEEAVNIPFSRDGEVLITAANGSTRLVGKRAKISGLMGKTVHGGFMLIAATEQPDFLCALMGTEWYRNFLRIGVAGGNGAIGNLDSHALECEKIRIPSSDEQHLVGGFFRDLDSLIDLQQRKYERLQHLKQALLRKMLV